MNSSLPAYLAQEGWVIDLSVVGEEEGFAEDEGKTAISFEGEEDVFLAGCGKGTVLEAAEIFVVGLHEVVAAAEVNLVCAKVTLDDEEAVFNGAVV